MIEPGAHRPPIGAVGRQVQSAHGHYIYDPAAMGARRGGGKKGHLPPPPLEIKKYRGPHKDNLTRNFF